MSVYELKWKCDGGDRWRRFNLTLTVFFFFFCFHFSFQFNRIQANHIKIQRMYLTSCKIISNDHHTKIKCRDHIKQKSTQNQRNNKTKWKERTNERMSKKKIEMFVFLSFTRKQSQCVRLWVVSEVKYE